MDREKAINCLTDIEQIMICRQEICPQEELQYWIELQEGVADALALMKEQETMSVDLFMQWCIDSHIMGDATVRGIEYWVGKFKEGR